jgi:uncharacterized protein YhbP (UPF0306 family)
MTLTNIKFNNSEYPDEKLNASISRILNENILGSVASINNNESYIHTAYFSYNKALELFFISDPATQHTFNIEKNPSVAIAIYDSKQPWDNNKCGLQIFGKCEIAKNTKLVEGTMLYLKRFAGLKQWIKHPDDFVKGAINSKMFLITPHSIKLFDEETFGEENFISLNINID